MKSAIILAGGKGTRMKSDNPKVMCEVIFEPMISHVVREVKHAGIESICVIMGYKHEIVENYLKTIDENIDRTSGAATRHRSRRNAGKGVY